MLGTIIFALIQRVEVLEFEEHLRGNYLKQSILQTIHRVVS